MRLQAVREYVHSYSPYHNIPTSTSLPPTFVTSSLTDVKVRPSESAKYVARRRSIDVNTPLLLISEEDSSHHILVSICVYIHFVYFTIILVSDEKSLPPLYLLI